MNARAPNRLLGCFFLPFLGAGLVFFALIAYEFVRETRPWFWVRSECPVIDTRVEETKVIARYRHGDFESETSFEYSSREEAESAVGRLCGAALTCYINQGTPEATLRREPPWIGLFAVIPLVFIMVGAGGFYAFVTRKVFKSSGTAISASARRGAPAPPCDAAVPAGPVTLRPSVARPYKFFGLLLFCVIWNGVVSVFIWQLWVSWRSGNLGWFETVFMIPFVLVGAVLVIGTIYQFLALFSPRAFLTLDAGKVRLGGRAGIQWEVLGRVSAVRRFRISLEASESAAYTRGTNSYTDTEVFYTWLVADKLNPIEIERGSAEFAIPAASMHSFEARRNRIVWKLRVRADVADLPDIDDEYPFTVEP